jgi:hypothetical protein
VIKTTRPIQLWTGNAGRFFENGGHDFYWEPADRSNRAGHQGHAFTLWRGPINQNHHKSKEREIPRGIFFVEMEPGGADAAIRALNGKERGERILHVRYVQDEDGKDATSF